MSEGVITPRPAAGSAAVDDGRDWPVAIIQDRYGGCYSGGAWLAIGKADRLENGAYRIVRCLEGGPSGDDVEAGFFWDDPPTWIAVGSTPDDASKALAERSAGRDEAVLAELDRKIAEGTADLEAGRVHTAEEVRAFLRAYSGQNVDAAE